MYAPYPENMMESVKKVEATRAERMATEPRRLTADEKDALLKEFHPDYNPDAFAQIKAFTKTYAMAGLRLGYMIADTDFVCDVQRQLPMWNVSAAAQIGGITAINDNDYLEKGKQIIREEREFLMGELKNLGFKVFNSDVNFILFKGSVGLDKSLLKREILIRNCGNFNGLDEGFYRIAVKKHDENAEFIRELGDICG